MSSITTSLSNLLTSILDIFRSLIAIFFSGIQSLFSIFSTLVNDITSLATGAVGFVLNNIVIIGILIAAAVGFSAYQQNTGRRAAGGKKRA
ncbi:hypothetical protein MMC24_004101 [Lignoscripta atroalba]|nr:hypothetical protein [Lignoscripta atroalba]